MAAVKLLIIDELGFVPLSKTGAELLFEMISQRYERGATLITSNLPFDEWTETFGTERLTGALLDRLCDLIPPRSASIRDVAFAFIGPPRSACNVSWSAGTACWVMA